MITVKQKAAALTAARTTKQQVESYQSFTQQSRENLKEKIGMLLLALQIPLSQEQRKAYWILFDSILRQYLDFRCSGVLL